MARAVSMWLRRSAGLMPSWKALRAAWWDSRVTSPVSLHPGRPRAPEAAASAEETTAECPSIRGM